MLSVRGLAVGGLEAFDLHIDAGECVALSGPSGSGKTLVLRALADLDPAAGAVALDGHDRDAMAAPDWRRQVCYLAAEPAWWADRIADHFSDRAAAAALMPALDLAEGLMNQEVATVSTGERQRLALIRALLLSPRVMLLDEPTSGLDEAAAARVEAILRARLAEGVAILVVSHDSAFAGRIAGRRLRIAGGRVEAA